MSFRRGRKETEVEAKLDRLIDFFETVNKRLERLENGCRGKALEEKIENVVEMKTEELWEEKVEKEKREMNLVFTNIPESSGEDGRQKEERGPENGQTNSLVKQIVKKICPDVEEEINEPTRLGQFNLAPDPGSYK